MRRDKLIPLKQLLSETLGEIMGINVNKIILQGRVGRAPEQGNSEKPMAKFSLATNNYKGEATWHNIICFGKTAENVLRHVIAGHELYIEGTQEHKSYEKSGQKKYFSQVIANLVQFGNKPGSPETTESGETKEIGEQFTSDQIPF